MDPHLRAVRNWNKDYRPDEKEAYHQARINGFIFRTGSNNKIGSLWEDELENIASHPPVVDLKTYKHYKNMDMNELKKSFPELVYIIGENNITHEDLFYHATRGFIPEYDSIDMKIKRYKDYQDMSEVGRDLIDRIYSPSNDPNQKTHSYINSTPHSLEKYIMAYDKNMEDDSALRSIASNLDIVLPYNIPAHESLYDYFVDEIAKKVPRSDYGVF